MTTLYHCPDAHEVGQHVVLNNLKLAVVGKYGIFNEATQEFEEEKLTLYKDITGGWAGSCKYFLTISLLGNRVLLDKYALENGSPLGVIREMNKVYNNFIVLLSH